MIDRPNLLTSLHRGNHREGAADIDSLARTSGTIVRFLARQAKDERVEELPEIGLGNRLVNPHEPISYESTACQRAWQKPANLRKHCYVCGMRGRAIA